MTDTTSHGIARISGIERFCTHDGPGIRTTVFFKGCPLNCRWCHNPENIAPAPVLSFHAHLCHACGVCVDVCPRQAHSLADGRHSLDRSKCQLCFACSEACRHGALGKIGRSMQIDEMEEILLSDRIFYETSEGGVTLSGGEPMLQHRFLGELLPRLQESGIHICIQTCGFGPRDVFLELAPMIDLFLWDVKHTDPEQHSRLTGRSNDMILDNLRAVDGLGSRVWLRCILVKGVNMDDDHLEQLGKLAMELRNCERIDLIPYHAYGRAKAESLGIQQQRFEAPSPDRMDWAQWRLARIMAEQQARGDAK